MREDVRRRRGKFFIQFYTVFVVKFKFLPYLDLKNDKFRCIIMTTAGCKNIFTCEKTFFTCGKNKEKREKMNIINGVCVCRDYAEMSRLAADVFSDYVRENPKGVLGLATGSTPIGIYECLVADYKAGKLDFSEITSYNLDEYYPIEPTHEQSYRRFMNENLFDFVNIDKAKTFVPDGKCEDPAAFCADYDKRIAAAGGIGVQLLGVGRNGHIGFNEPADALIGGTHLADLTDSTIDANSRFFDNREDVPKQAITMGIDPIMAAKTVVLVINGKEKHEALMALLSGVYDTHKPVTLLRGHRDLRVFCDEAAYYGN